MTTETHTLPLCDWDDPANPTFDMWTTVNAAEVVPGVMYPLLAGWYQTHQRVLFASMFKRLGVTEQIAILPDPVPNFVGFWAGHLGLNVSFTTAIVTSYQTGAGSSAVEKLFTADEEGGHVAEASENVEQAIEVRKRFMRILGQVPRMVPSDRKKTAALDKEVAETDLPSLTDAQLRRLHNRINVDFRRNFENHILISVCGSGEFISMLEAHMSANSPDLDADATVKLTSALGNVESAKPMEALWHISRSIHKRPGMAAEIATLSWQQIQQRVDSPPNDDWRAIAEQFAAFVEAYGYRSQSEWDHAVPRWSEEPSFPLNSLRNMAQASDEEGPLEAARRAGAQREAAEEHYRSLLPVRKRTEYNRLLASAQDFVRVREYTKATCVISIRAARAAIREQGRRWAERGWLEQGDDIFYLLHKEYEQGQHEKLDPALTKEAVRRRKAQFKDMESFVLPDNWTGLPEVSRRGAAPVPDRVLKGLGVSPGEVTGPARVITSFAAGAAADFKPGDILVAPFTDAPWTPLFATAGGVVVETGGVLSHAATVAREYGIPAVAMIKDATRMIQTGQRLTVNGGAGEVTLG